MKITVMASELVDRGIWLDACLLLELNEWALNEGAPDFEIELSLEQAIKLGLLPLPTDSD